MPVVSQNSMIVFEAVTIYIIVGALFKEQKLEREFGECIQNIKLLPLFLFRGCDFGGTNSLFECL
jgi:hypothetical protein